MFQAPDYTILDHLSARCAVVDSNYRYLYVNKAAARQEHMSREEMLGRSMLDVHPKDEMELIAPHLQECLQTHKPVDFQDEQSKWRIKIEPVQEGAFIHWIRLPASKTRVKVRNSAAAPFHTENRYPPFALEALPAFASSLKTRPEVLEVEGWLDSLDIRTKETNEHILRVTHATVVLARLLGIPESEIECIGHGALLHDVGKIGIPDAILLKPDKLSPGEWDVVRKHPLYAYDLLSPVEYFRNCLDIPYSHHEKWDGTGYPQGLKGEQIPLPARLFAVVDVWDSLSFDRVYRKAWSPGKVMDYIQGQSGYHFDPTIVELFFRSKKELASVGRR